MSLAILHDIENVIVTQAIGRGETGEALADILSAIETAHSIRSADPQVPFST